MTADHVAALRAACHKQLDPVTVDVIETRGLDRDEVLAVLVPSATLTPVVELLKAERAKASRVDAVKHAMGDT